MRQTCGTTPNQHVQLGFSHLTIRSSDFLLPTSNARAVGPYLILKSIINQRTGVVERKELTAHVGENDFCLRFRS